MGIAKLSDWYDRFGLGRRTGIGIEENRGLLYRPSAQMPLEAQMQAYPMGIGEGQYVQATPIQMANVAATLARNGVWMRPRLVAADQAGRLGARSSDPADSDRVDLHLSPRRSTRCKLECGKSAQSGGSGYMILPQYVDLGPDEPPLAQDPLVNIQIAGKTGSAQTGGFMSLVDHDANGKPTGIRQVHFGDPGTEGWYSQPNTPMGILKNIWRTPGSSVMPRRTIRRSHLPCWSNTARPAVASPGRSHTICLWTASSTGTFRPPSERGLAS